MTQRGRTKDEYFVLCTYEQAQKKGDILAEINRYDVGRDCGLNIKAVDTICTLLAKANFIKKVGEINIHLTEHGAKLAERLQMEK